MSESIILENEFFKIFTRKDGVYVETFKRGYPLSQLSSVLLQHPEIAVTSLNTFRNSINQAPRKPEKFAELKERISVEIIDSGLKASLVFNMPDDKLDISNRENIKNEVYSILKKNGIIYGIKAGLFEGELSCGKSYIIAEGTRPINGTDAVIRMYELQDTKPEVREDGRVDYYEMKLINRVKTGDWLGERIEATNGYPGQSVKGTALKPEKGRTYQLNFDRNSVYEIYNNGKTTLYARFNGAVNYTDGRINVSNHLEIDGDIGVGTGNIKFDGYITVKGTVCDGFSVQATKDIEINSPLGLGSVKSIESTGGSIFIRGGILSKNMALVKAAKNIFLKFADTAIIICGGTAHIGYYSLNSNITADEIVLDALNGRIIGGLIKARIRVLSPVIGSESERRTSIEVTGFDRKMLGKELNELFRRTGELKSEQQKLKQVLANSSEKSSMNPFQRKEYENANERIFSLRNEIRNLEERRKKIAAYIKMHGEGEIAAEKRIYPNCILTIKGCTKEITSLSAAVTYFAQNGEIRQV